MQKYKGLIFDFNGVLLIDQHLHDEVWKRIARDVTGREPTKEELIRDWHGRSNNELLENLYGRKLSREEIERIAEEKELKYQDIAREQGGAYVLAEGAIELFEALKARKVPFTIGTSSPSMNIVFYNQMLGLDRWFDISKVVCNDGTLRGKPAPDIYLKAASNLELSPHDCVVIEDAELGIAAAHAAGVDYTIAIGPKEEHERLSALNGVSEVIEILKQVEVEKLF